MYEVTYTYYNYSNLVADQHETVLTNYAVKDIPEALASYYGTSYEINITSIRQVTQTLILKEQA